MYSLAINWKNFQLHAVSLTPSHLHTQTHKCVSTINVNAFACTSTLSRASRIRRIPCLLGVFCGMEYILSTSPLTRIMIRTCSLLTLGKRSSLTCPHTRQQASCFTTPMAMTTTPNLNLNQRTFRHLWAIQLRKPAKSKNN